MFFASDNIYYMCLFVCCLSHAYLFDTVVRLLSTNLLTSFLPSFFLLFYFSKQKPKKERNGYVKAEQKPLAGAGGHRACGAFSLRDPTCASDVARFHWETKRHYRRRSCQAGRLRPQVSDWERIKTTSPSPSGKGPTPHPPSPSIQSTPFLPAPASLCSRSDRSPIRSPIGPD